MATTNVHGGAISFGIGDVYSGPNRIVESVMIDNCSNEDPDIVNFNGEFIVGAGGGAVVVFEPRGCLVITDGFAISSTGTNLASTTIFVR